MVNQYYYVAFTGTKSRSLYERFEKEGFNHVMIFFPQLGENLSTATYFTIIEHRKTFVNLGYVERDSLEAYLENATVIEVKTKRSVRPKWWWWIPTPDTCVTIAKQILGIHAPFVWTPYQLYKHIQRRMKWADL